MPQKSERQRSPYYEGCPGCWTMPDGTEIPYDPSKEGTLEGVCPIAVLFPGNAKYNPIAMETMGDTERLAEVCPVALESPGNAKINPIAWVRANTPPPGEVKAVGDRGTAEEQSGG